MCPLGAYLANVATDVIAVAVNGVLTLRALVEADDHRVGIQSGNDRTRSSLVEELTTIVVTDGDQHPVARLQRLAHSRPEVGVERASRHAAQRLILHGDFPSVEELRGIESPTPLTIGAIATSAVAHRRIADKEQHGVVALTSGTGCGPRHQSLCDRVGRVVDGHGQRIAHPRRLFGVSGGVRQVVKTCLRSNGQWQHAADHHEDNEG